MTDEWYRVADAAGQKGVFRTLEADASRIEVRLESGERLWMPRALVRATQDGSFVFDHPFASLLAHSPGSQVAVPVVQEELEVSKRTVQRERVRVHTTVSQREETVDLPLIEEELKVERVPVGRVVERHELPHQEGDVFIVPVYEEVLYVEKRLVLREELHVRCVRHETHAPQRLTVRTMEAKVERTPLGDGTNGRTRSAAGIKGSEAS